MADSDNRQSSDEVTVVGKSIRKSSLSPVSEQKVRAYFDQVIADQDESWAAARKRAETRAAQGSNS